MGTTSQLAAFVAGPAVAAAGARVLHLAKRSILDGVGLAIAGARSRAHGIVLAQDDAARTNGSATVLGTGKRRSARWGALLNGLAIHAHDYDDTQLAVADDRVYGLLTHPTAPVLPAALALTERTGASGSELLEAYLVGVEVACKVAEALDPRHYHDGFHTTGTAGAIGAGAAGARALGLDQDRAAIALSLAASQAAGIRENFGTMAKPLHAGRAAESGVLAADLSAGGFTASPVAMEAPRGFFRAAAGGYDPAAVDDALGAPWSIAEPGLSIKPHPSGSLTHPAMWAVRQLMNEHGVGAADVASVTVGTNASMPNALIHHRPQNELQAKFSMEFCVAIMLLEGRAGLAEFDDAVVSRTDVRDLIERVDFRVDEEAEAAGYAEMLSIVCLELRNGERVEARSAHGKGHPANPMSDEELVDKFVACLDWGGVPEGDARSLAERVMNLEQEPSVVHLLDAVELPFRR